jgi:CRP-like cAMP-binding protein/Pyruvate/2-oxoacid:ferredoxin oxidoreductase delta subunit
MTAPTTPDKEITDVKLEGEPLQVDDLLKLDIFQGASANLLEKNTGAVVRRRFKRGDLICREGDFGATAFYILKGKADVFISTPMAHARSRARGDERGWKAFFRKLTSLAGSREDPRGEQVRRWIPIDAPVDLDYNHPIAQLHEGDLFGEMTCMNFYPRSATVRAAADCEMLEMLRNILDILQRNKTFKAQLEETYRRRALDNHLRSIPIFAKMPQDFLDYLRQRVELVRFNPGDVICRQDDLADSFYLIRLGFVKVTQQHPGGEFVLSYLGRGQYFGEIGLLIGGQRTATCAALDHVEVVRIKAEDFSLMVERFPDIRQALTRTANERLEENRRLLTTVRTVPLDDFLVQGLMEAQSLLLLDLEKCTRCDDCVRACAAAHDGITRLYREGLRFDKYLVATSCRSCMDPLCMIGCPVGSIRRKNDREILIEDWCIGCGLCARQCPYGNITMHEFEMPGAEAGEPEEGPGRKKAAIKKKAATCDLCIDYKEPACVYACPHGAAKRVDNPREFISRQQVVTSPPVQIKFFKA